MLVMRFDRGLKQFVVLINGNLDSISDGDSL